MTKRTIIMAKAPDRLELNTLIKQAQDAFNALPHEEQEAMLEAQRQSWVRGNLEIDRPDPILPDNGALRHNEGKPRYDLIPPEFLEALAQLFTDNCTKYPPRNWERGMDWQKMFASLMRHAWAWERKNDFDFDEKSGSHHHMVMAAWNCMALYVYHVRKIGVDDRPNSVNNSVKEYPL